MRYRYPLLVTSVLGIVFLSIFLVGNKPVESSQSLKTLEQVEQTEPALSTRLRIPKIQVNALVESVGLTPEGKMDAPEGPDNVGWYNLGPELGGEGNAVIDGHSGWKNAEPSVFDNLHKLEKGDKIYIEDKTGNIVTFIVRESRTYDSEADASEVFLSNDDGSHLNLITCAGDWDEVSKSSPKRLVVFSDKMVIRD